MVSAACFNQLPPTALTFVLYDVTTLYFEIQKDDDYRYRQKRANLDLSNIDKTVAKAQKIIDKKADISRRFQNIAMV